MESWRGNSKHGPPPPPRRDRWRRPDHRDKHDQDRDYTGGDGYDNRPDLFSRRPPPPSSWRSEPEPPRRLDDVYGPPPGLSQATGASGGDFSRWSGPPSPSRRHYHSSRPLHEEAYDSRHPQTRQDRYDDARPPQGDFSFRMEKPAGMGESRDTSSQFRRRGGGRGGPGFAPRKRLAADRPMLSLAQTSNSDEITLGVDDTRSKYRAVVDLTDEPESDGSGGGEDGHANKRIRTEAAAPPVDNTPKWSNPDPYSVLPPMETGSRKTTTIIDLIQKARIENDEKKAVTTVVEDFISFDDEDDGKRSARNRRGRSPSSSPEPSQHRNRSRSRDRRDAAMAERETDPLGSRKRTFDDNLKPPSYIKAKGKALREAALGEVISEWAAVPEEDDCPWNQRDCTGNPQLNHWLHEEIVDFYDHVKPRSFERKIRGKLVSMLEKFIQRDPMFRDISVQSFGSFASDLYLPTADMDLVICSRRFLDNGVPTISGSKWLHRFRAALVKYNIAEQGTIDLILHAKVPIVKYIDRDSGLRVDVSFENLSGVDAIETFQKWKKLYPAMPILVTVIKHFLGMRGLNEPVNGGIGGFSVVCLVVSMFQLMPPVQSRALQPERHLGEMLMEFFRLYGSFHNFGSVAIRLDPPGYIPKSNVSQVVYKGHNQNKLSIIDPNNPANDIAGGSSNYPVVRACFQEAYALLKHAMNAGGIAKDDRGRSVLRSILSGNYTMFRQQRDFLRQVYEKRYGPSRD